MVRQPSTWRARTRGATLRVACVTALVLPALAACHQTPPPATVMTDARNGEIVFARSSGRVARLMVVDPRGGPVRSSGPMEGTVGDPAWSPDGSLLAFAWRRWPAGYRIAILDHRGGDVRALTDGSSIDAGPTWSPDGSRLAFARVGGSQPWLFLVPLRGGDPQPLTPGRAPDWSPRGETLAFERGAPTASDLFTYDPAEGTVTAVVSSPTDDRDPDWSPDGSSIAFASDRDGDFDIYVLELDSGRIRRVTDFPGDERWPAWSPDGREIAFARISTTSSSIWLVEADGAHGRPLTSGHWDGAPAWRPAP